MKEYVSKYICDNCKKEKMVKERDRYAPKLYIDKEPEGENESAGWEEVHMRSNKSYLLCSEKCISEFFPIIFEEEKSVLLEQYRKNQLHNLKK